MVASVFWMYACVSCYYLFILYGCVKWILALSNNALVERFAERDIQPGIFIYIQAMPRMFRQPPAAWYLEFQDPCKSFRSHCLSLDEFNVNVKSIETLSDSDSAGVELSIWNHCFLFFSVHRRTWSPRCTSCCSSSYSSTGDISSAILWSILPGTSRRRRLKAPCRATIFDNSLLQSFGLAVCCCLNISHATVCHLSIIIYCWQIPLRHFLYIFNACPITLWLDH